MAVLQRRNRDNCWERIARQNVEHMYLFQKQAINYSSSYGIYISLWMRFAEGCKNIYIKKSTNHLFIFVTGLQIWQASQKMWIYFRSYYSRSLVLYRVWNMYIHWTCDRFNICWSQPFIADSTWCFRYTFFFFFFNLFTNISWEQNGVNIPPEFVLLSDF